MASAGSICFCVCPSESLIGNVQGHTVDVTRHVLGQTFQIMISLLLANKYDFLSVFMTQSRVVFENREQKLVKKIAQFH